MITGTKFCVLGPIRKNIKLKYPQKIVTLRYEYCAYTCALLQSVAYMKCLENVACMKYLG